MTEYLYNVSSAKINSLPKLFSWIEFNAFPIAEAIILMFGFVSFISIVSKFGLARAFSSSMVISFISSLLLFLMGILNDVWVYGTAVGLGISILMLHFNKD